MLYYSFNYNIVSKLYYNWYSILCVCYIVILKGRLPFITPKGPFEDKLF